ncbi:MAG: hypothetical protein INR73_02640 [Williamsia sp.]|nr:hypothetical protein [Williamsia sp.]
MNRSLQKTGKALCTLCALLLLHASYAQSDADAIMMNKKQLCNGFSYDHASWDHYWEGTRKRNNENLGTVTNQSIMYMGAYGITDKLNITATLPYIWTKASAGTLHPLNGLQDGSLFIKWIPVSHKFGEHKLRLFAMGGISTPLSNYAVDFLPMSIGLGSTNLTARGMVDYNWNRFTVTGAASFIWRSNVTLDKDAYYDTQAHLTNEVKMPHATQYQLRTGYRGKYLIAEALLTRQTTLGGFDITRNNSPFPSNRFNSTNIGLYLKYTLKPFTNLSLQGGGNYTVAGRNVGQTKAFNLGVFYAFYTGKK